VELNYSWGFIKWAEELTKLVKSGFLMIIHIYVKVSIYWISLREKGRTLPLSL
jgi:hypothetical protein